MTEQLIQGSRPRFGLFNDAVDVDLQNYAHRTVTGKPASAFSRWIGYKRFQYFGILSDEVLAGCAIAHLRHTAIAFVYVFSPKHGMLFEKTFRAPLALGCRLSSSAVSGESEFSFGKTLIKLGYHDEPRRKSLCVNVPGKLNIEAEFNETAAEFEPMSLCTRIGRNGWVYAHKVAAVPVSGHIHCAGNEFDLSQVHAYAHHDFSAGYMRRETFWNWACFSGQDVKNNPIGLNVSCGVNETSYSENCYWRDGKLEPLGLCQFDYDWERPENKPWSISNQDGRLDIEFILAGQHVEKLNVGLIKSDFKQIFGHFNGRIRQADGKDIIVRDLPGFVEDQYAKW